MTRLLLLVSLIGCAPAVPDLIDADGDGVAAPLDCDDLDGERYPGAAETCDGVDQDCDGLVDEDAIDRIESWADADRDGFGAGEPALDCVVPLGNVLDDSDCDDTDAAVRPSAEELCDEVDRDCDGSPHAGAVDAPDWFEDADEDGFAGTVGGRACTPPEGGKAEAEDCDDSDPDVFPGAVELCDTIDQDCDGGLGFGVVAGVQAPTLQAAVDLALDGETVCVPAGRWTGFRAVDRELTLIGGAGHAIDVKEGLIRQVGGHLTLDRIRLEGVTRGGIDARSGRLSVRALEVPRVELPAVEDGGIVRDGGLLYLREAEVEIDGLHVERVQVDQGEALVAWPVGVLLRAELSDVVLRDLRVDGAKVETGAYAAGLVSVAHGSLSGEAWVIENVKADGMLRSVTDAYDAEVELRDVRLRYLSGQVFGAAIDGMSCEVVLSDIDLLSSSQRGDIYASYAALVEVVNGSLDVTRLRVLNSSADHVASWIYVAGAMEAVELRNVIVAESSVTSSSRGDFVSTNNTRDTNIVIENASFLSEGEIVMLDGGSAELINVEASGTRALTDSYTHPIEIRYSNLNGSYLRDEWDSVTVRDLLFLSPDYVDTSPTRAEDWDLRLQSTSALIDAGDPDVLDADGTRSDIGAFGGPGAAGW